ncbi:MAG: HD domain-containing protein [Candidatus Nealsonbacteria bacterium]|nr:HD domain-containing protein [Candidatus Nealsonbacteria bacterium]
MIIPKEIKDIILKLNKAGFEAYVVGGCVRDILTGVDPKDWDVTTSAKPEELRKLFPKSFYENKFYTVTVQTNSKNPVLKEIEVTTFRSETKYTDKRHPDEIKPAKNLKEDLARRDFTVNALALRLRSGQAPEIIDHFGGRKDLEDKLIRAVGNPAERFDEDALRLMRAVRFAATLGFAIENKTLEAIRENAETLSFISKERIRDEFLKIAMSENAAQGLELLRENGLLKFIIPELEEGYGVGQNKHHIYDCYTHNLLSFKYAAQKGFNQQVRIAALLHDVAKPRVKRGNGPNSTFYNHEVVGAKMAAQILDRLRFSKKDAEKIVKLVRYHLFYYNVDEVTESSVRRLVRNVGPENMEELLQVRMCDRIGSGVPKAEPYKLRHLKYVIDKVSQDPISVKMLKVSGNDIMKLLKIKPGPKIGKILDILLGKVLDDPKNNTKAFLEKQLKDLSELSEKELEKLANEAKDKRQKLEIKRDNMTKSKYWVT